MNTESFIRETVLGDEQIIKQSFLSFFEREIRDFIKYMSITYDKWRILDSTLSTNEEKAYISALAYSAINQHIVSLKLFISGYFIPSGNIQRQVFESVAMALLASKIELGYLHRFIKGKYSTNKAIKDLQKQYKKLSLDKEALNILARQYLFYHKFSHITYVTLASSISAPYKGTSISYLGAAFDPGRLEIYRKEIESKVGFAIVLPNVIEGIALNTGVL